MYNTQANNLRGRMEKGEERTEIQPASVGKFSSKKVWVTAGINRVKIVAFVTRFKCVA